MIESHQKTIYEALGREPVHPFPARMAPGIALEIISNARRPLRVLDPMMGSGTVVAVARAKGHKAVGFDIDPLAVLISKVWTTTHEPEEVRAKSYEVLDRARKIFATLMSRDAYPPTADHDTRRFIRYWFDEYARRQLASLAMAIGRVRDGVIRDALWCGFSRLIIAKQAGASLAMDLSHSRPHKAFTRAPTKPFRKFLAVMDRVIENCLVPSREPRGPAPVILQGDARDLPLRNASIDLVLTSPPYVNAIDYMRCSKFSLVWMGHGVSELRQLRAESVGTEVGAASFLDDEQISQTLRDLHLRPKLADRQQAILARYIADMRQALLEIARVLSPNGKAVYVIGENTIRGTYVRNSTIVSAAASLAGLRLHNRQERDLPANRRYLPPPSGGNHAALDTRMRREVVLAFKKT